jgi:16S rRNA (guanine527-N7)-methyltransferase
LSELDSPAILEREIGNIGVELSLAQLEQFQRYYGELIEWNSRMNLTSITEWEAVQTRHYLDSLTVALVIPEEILGSGRFVDIGSGGGFPGVPLIIAFPGMKGTLIEATGKKATFLQHLKDTMELDGLEIQNGRSETLAHDPSLRESFDVVLARSVSGMASLAEMTLPFCRIGGLVVAHKGQNIEDEMTAAAKAITVTGGTIKEVRAISLEGLSERSLVVLEKVSPSPDRLPRRPGMPSKRPL